MRKTVKVETESAERGNSYPSLVFCDGPALVAANNPVTNPCGNSWNSAEAPVNPRLFSALPCGFPVTGIADSTEHWLLNQRSKDETVRTFSDVYHGSPGETATVFRPCGILVTGKCGQRGAPAQYK